MASDTVTRSRESFHSLGLQEARSGATAVGITIVKNTTFKRALKKRVGPFFAQFTIFKSLTMQQNLIKIIRAPIKLKFHMLRLIQAIAALF
jgi:ABC-type arginine transport system ATPase subunit